MHFITKVHFINLMYKRFNEHYAQQSMKSSKPCFQMVIYIHLGLSQQMYFVVVVVVVVVIHSFYSGDTPYIKVQIQFNSSNAH